MDKISPLKLFDDNKTLIGFNLRRLLFHQNQSDYVSNIFDKVIGLWKDGKVKPVIDSTWAFEDVSIYLLCYILVLIKNNDDICLLIFI